MGKIVIVKNVLVPDEMSAGQVCETYHRHWIIDPLQTSKHSFH